jgi:hypothetical protein
MSQVDIDDIIKVLDERIPQMAFDEGKGGNGSVSNLIQPTLQMIEDVIRAHLIDGKPPGQIKKEIKSSDGKSLSWGQIRQIIREADKYKAAKVAAEAAEAKA